MPVRRVSRAVVGRARPHPSGDHPEDDFVRVDSLEGRRLGRRTPHGHPERVHVALGAECARAPEKLWRLVSRRPDEFLQNTARGEGFSTLGLS